MLFALPSMGVLLLCEARTPKQGAAVFDELAVPYSYSIFAYKFWKRVYI
jgi:hypothetical protein